MKTISNVNLYGYWDSVLASKYPKAVNTTEVNAALTDTVKNLAKAQIGSGHDNFLNGVVVQFDLTLSMKAWVEAERYHFLDFVSSQSTMHCITKFNIAEQCNEYVDKSVVSLLKGFINAYTADPSSENYLRVLYNIPSGFRLTARMTTNYRQLKTIYTQRYNHRLPEWKEVCDWITTLPLMDVILKLNQDTKEES